MNYKKYLPKGFILTGITLATAFILWLVTAVLLPDEYKINYCTGAAVILLLIIGLIIVLIWMWPRLSKGTSKYMKKKIMWFVITLVAAILLNFFLPRLMRGAGTKMLYDPMIRPYALEDEDYKAAVKASEKANDELKESNAKLTSAQILLEKDSPEYKAIKKENDELSAAAEKARKAVEAAFERAYRKNSDELSAKVNSNWGRIENELKPLAYEDDEVIEAKLKEIAGGDERFEKALYTILGNNSRVNANASYAKVLAAKEAGEATDEDVEAAHKKIQTAWNADCDRYKQRLGQYHERSDVSIVDLVNKQVLSTVQDDAYWTTWLNAYDTVEKDLGRNGGMFGELWGFIRHIFDGTFGKSTSTTRYPNSVWSIISEGITWTLSLQIPAILMGWILGNVLGAVAAYRRKIWDKAVMPASLFVSAIPAFGSAVILLVIFGISLKWFPANRAYDPGMIPALSLKFIGNVLWHYQLPFWSIVLISIGGQAVGMRSMSIYELNADYVKYSRFLGITDGRIVRYVFRNAMLPQVTGLAMSIGASIGGALVAETIFSYPGLGMKMYAAISENDYNTVSGIALIITIMVLIAAFLLDLIYAVIDPRVKAAQFD